MTAWCLQMVSSISGLIRKLTLEKRSLGPGHHDPSTFTEGIPLGAAPPPHSVEPPNDGSGNTNSSQECFCQFVVTGCDTPEILQTAEGALANRQKKFGAFSPLIRRPEQFRHLTTPPITKRRGKEIMFQPTHQKFIETRPWPRRIQPSPVAVLHCQFPLTRCEQIVQDNSTLVEMMPTDTRTDGRKNISASRRG